MGEEGGGPPVALWKIVRVQEVEGDGRRRRTATRDEAEATAVEAMMKPSLAVGEERRVRDREMRSTRLVYVGTSARHTSTRNGSAVAGCLPLNRSSWGPVGP